MYRKGWVMTGKRFYFAVAGMMAAMALKVAAAAVIDNADCLICHDDKDLSRKDSDGKVNSLFVNPAVLKTSVHGSNACVSCHADITDATHPDKFKAKPATCTPCHDRAVSTYEASAHSAARRAGKLGAAKCVDCHGKHDIVKTTLPSSPLHHSNLASTCGKCHAPIVQEVSESVHGKAMAHGVREAPTCTDCHSDHATEQLSSVTPMKIAEQVCSRCHASERLNTKFNLPSNRVRTFFESYHGLAAKLGSTRTANCASCHGFHSILPSSDPRSMVHPGNIVRTCQKCHPGSNEKFSQGKVHLDMAMDSDIGGRVNRLVRQIYLVLIICVIGALSGHNILLFRKKLLIAYKDKDRSFVRMNLVQRIQHILLALSFIYLSISGFALKFPDSWVSFIMGSSEEMRRGGHRVAAIIMLALALFHTVYLLATTDGRKVLRDMLPCKKDFLDTWDAVKYLLLADAPKPRFARFGYPEKAEYWAVVWGTIIMGGTGLMIWFKMGVTEWVPRWVIDVAVTIHYYEAILAVLAIIVWHFYHVIFDPDVYPLNLAWWDGKVTEHWYKDEHPMDDEGPKEKNAGGDTANGEKAKDSKRHP